MKTTGFVLALVAALSIAGLTMTSAMAATDDTQASRDAVANTLRDMYAALSADDMAKFKSIVTDDFYAYDLGRRYDGAALALLVMGLHKEGKKLVWTVNKPDVHIDGNTACIAYVNTGSVGDATTVTPMTWLESAMLRRDGGRWRIAFFHSTRAQPAT
jgi:ketosteroid isomerase-like protein